MKSRFTKISWAQEKILKHQEDRHIKHLQISHLNFWYKRPYEILHTYKEIYQNEIYWFTTNSQEPIIIDCGSNIGLSIIYYKTLYPNATVIAFEPDEDNFSLLERNVLANNLTNVNLNKSAIWVSDGEISFEGNESEASHISENSSSKKVGSTRLSTIINKYEKIDFLKMDIEGAEWDVIRDCRNNLGNVNNLFLEYHGKVNETNKLKDLLEIVEQNGFSVYIKNAADNISHPFVEKTTKTTYDVQLNIFCYK
jgi:FkbM family methyltransferase